MHVPISLIAPRVPTYRLTGKQKSSLNEGWYPLEVRLLMLKWVCLGAPSGRIDYPVPECLDRVRSRQTISNPPVAINTAPGNNVDHGVSLKKSHPNPKAKGIPK